jgi:hypothetical protein
MPTNQYNTTWLASQFPLLSCHSADHSQQHQALLLLKGVPLSWFME